MNISKDYLHKIQSDLDNEKKQISNQLYLSISNLMKKLHDPDPFVNQLQEQVSDLADFHVSKQDFQSVRDMADYVAQFKETLQFLRPYYESNEAQHNQHNDFFMYL